MVSPLGPYSWKRAAIVGSVPWDGPLARALRYVAMWHVRLGSSP
jgi:hypothetical protein